MVGGALLQRDRLVVLDPVQPLCQPAVAPWLPRPYH